MTVSFKQTLSDWLSKTDWADLVVFSRNGKEIGPDTIDLIEKQNQVKNVFAYRYYFIAYEHEKLSDKGFVFQGFDPDRFFAAPAFEIPGDAQNVLKNLALNTRAILINENLSLVIEKKAGDKISLPTTRGRQDFLIVGVVRDYSDFFHRLGKVIYGSLETLRFYWDAPGYSVLKIELTEDADVNSTRNRLERALAETNDLKMLTHEEELRDVEASVDRVFSIFYVFNAVLLIIIYISILQAVLVNVLHQIYELVMLRVLGCTAAQMRLVIVFQALIMGIIGAIAALSAGVWLARIMTETTKHFIGNILFSVSGVVLAAFFFISILISLLASLYPQKMISKINLSEMLSTIDQL
jgi:putative ABC transport system permease protein